MTPRSISTERQNRIKQEARKKHGINLDIYERKTLVNRLANFDNGIFNRHFPDIEKQVRDLVTNKPFLQPDKGSLAEFSVLRASVAFCFNKRAPHTRKSMVDYLTLGLLMGSAPMTIGELVEKYQKTIAGQRPPNNQIEASVDRLMSGGLLDKTVDRVQLSDVAKSTLASNTIRANEATEALIADVIEEVYRISESKLSAEECEILSQNTKDVLVKYFQLFGIEISNQILQDGIPSAVYLDSSEDLLNTAKRRLTTQMGELLISVISQILKNPTEEQAETLANWSLAYLGVEIMNLDPTLRELQSTRFSSKVFMLDTDFILDCVVSECPWSKVNTNLIHILRELGSRVIIPEYCIEECIKHAKIAHRTYNYFGQKLLSLSDSLVDVQVGNIFVQGYYYGRLNGSISPGTNFSQYLQNYFEPQAPLPFFTEVIRSALPGGIEIIDPSKLLTESIPEKQVLVMAKELARIMSTSRKAEYRSPDDIEHLAKIDSQLFLTAYYLSGQAEGPSAQFLGNCCYLLTASGRYRRSAKKVGLRDYVTTRPQTLIALLEFVGKLEITPTQLVSLFENPLLIYAVSQSWGDVGVLLDSGIMLRDKSIARLRWDLAAGLHNRIVDVEQAEQVAEVTDKPEPADIMEREYIDLIKSAVSRGYRRIPELEALMQSLEKAEDDAQAKEKTYVEMLEGYDELEKTITYFGKRRQKYLRRLASKIKKR